MRPWKYDAEMLAAFKFYTWLRASLVPYIRACGRVASAEGIPILRALPIEFPTDANAYRDDEYMFGPSIMVAPLVMEEAGPVRVYLPEGTWFNLFTHERKSGKTTMAETSKGWEQMPVYVRAPVILPLRLGRNSPQPGHSYFQSAGTALYSNPAIDAFQVFPVNDAARTDFPAGVVSYENNQGAVVLQIKMDDLCMKPIHCEIMDVRQVSRVMAGEVTLTAASSWQKMMERPEQYYYERAAKTLYVHSMGR